MQSPGELGWSGVIAAFDYSTMWAHNFGEYQILEGRKTEWRTLFSQSILRKIEHPTRLCLAGQCVPLMGEEPLHLSGLRGRSLDIPAEDDEFERGHAR